MIYLYFYSKVAILDIISICKILEYLVIFKVAAVSIFGKFGLIFHIRCDFVGIL